MFRIDKDSTPSEEILKEIKKEMNRLASEFFFDLKNSGEIYAKNGTIHSAYFECSFFETVPRSAFCFNSEINAFSNCLLTLFQEYNYDIIDFSLQEYDQKGIFRDSRLFTMKILYV